MKVLLSVLMFVACIVFPEQAFAWERTSTTQVVAIETGWYGEGLVVYVEAEDGVPGCPAQDHAFALEVAHPAYDEMVAMVMTAQAAGMRLNFVIEDRGVCGFGGRTKIAAVRLF